VIINKRQPTLLIEEYYKSPLGTLIKTEYNILMVMLSQVPPQSRTLKLLEGTGGKVSVADVVAYQIGWGTLLLGWYETGIQGKMPDMPGEGFATWDYRGLARHFYTKFHYDGSHEQDQKFHGIVQHILEIVEKEYQTDNLDKAGVWPWCTLSSGKQWPLSKWIRVNTVAPYKRASSLIRRFLKT
jgi:hypothetical protein